MLMLVKQADLRRTSHGDRTAASLADKSFLEVVVFEATLRAELR